MLSNTKVALKSIADFIKAMNEESRKTLFVSLFARLLRLKASDLQVGDRHFVLRTTPAEEPHCKGHLSHSEIHTTHESNTSHPVEPHMQFH